MGGGKEGFPKSAVLALSHFCALQASASELEPSTGWDQPPHPAPGTTFGETTTYPGLNPSPLPAADPANLRQSQRRASPSADPTFVVKEIWFQRPDFSGIQHLSDLSQLGGGTAGDQCTDQ